MHVLSKSQSSVQPGTIACLEAGAVEEVNGKRISRRLDVKELFDLHRRGQDRLAELDSVHLHAAVTHGGVRHGDVCQDADAFKIAWNLKRAA